MDITIYFLLGIFTCSSSVPIGEYDDFLGRIAAKFEAENSNLPEVTKRNDDEWVQLIGDIYQGKLEQGYEGQVPYIFKSNQTGNFRNSYGIKGSWNAISYVYYYFGDHQLRRHIFSVDDMVVGENWTVLASASDTLFTGIKAEQPAFAAAGVKLGVQFELKNYTGYNIIGRNYQLFVGSGADINGTTMYDGAALELVNVTNNYSISGSQTQGELRKGNSSGSLSGDFVSNSIPLSASIMKNSSPIDAEYLVKILREKEASSSKISVSEGWFKGDFTIGKEGIYNSDSSTLTRFKPDGNFVNSTSSLRGTYWEVNGTRFDSSFPLYNAALEYFLDNCI